MCYWLTWMVKFYNDSVQSIRSWESSVSWLGLCLSNTDNRSWYKHPAYQSLRKQVIREYRIPPCEKHPFTLRHLAVYTAHRKCFPGRYQLIDYDILLEVTWIQLMFLTMSRPCELLNRRSDKNKNGLRIRDIVYVRQYAYRYYQLKILHFKNQAARRVPKTVTIAPAVCGTALCLCTLINPFQLITECLRRRATMADHLISTKQRANLTIDAASHFFVHSDGSVMTTSNTKPVIAQMAQICRVLEPECYTEYSLRVGGATNCSAAGIPDALMYRYVGWDPSQLPDIAKRYQRPTLEMRLRMQHYMLHGFVQANGRCHGIRHLPGMIHDPWTGDMPNAWR